MRFTEEMIREYFAKGYWTEDTTSSIWERNAMLYPDKEAFVSSTRRLTWFQVKEISDRLAWGLIEKGFRKGDILFVLVPNCWESYVIRVACEKAGVICLTALMTLRESEIEYILKNFNANSIVIPWKFRSFDYYDAIREMQPRLPHVENIFVVGEEVPPGTISIQAMLEDPLEERFREKGFEETRIKATEVSTIACTSGTTGLPKGVEHAQCSRIAAARHYAEAVNLRREDIVLNIVSGVAGLGAAFCYNGSAGLVGAKSVLLEAWSPESTFQLIEKEKATVLVAVPAQLAQLIKDPNFKHYNLSSLRCISTGTAPLPARLATEIEETLGIPISNCYGQLDGGVVTHTTIDDPPEIRRTTVGRPAEGMIVKLLDEEGREVPEGEIAYCGPATNGGYYNDPESTLRAWGALGLGGFFRSGDLGRFNERGDLILIGRKKEVIIRGGQNIHPVEIESLLLTYPKIRSAAVVPMPDPIMGEKACAYVSLNPGERLTFEEMISFLRGKKIASYKLPERLEIMEEMPLRGYQKVAKRELQEDLLRKLKIEGKV